MLWSTINCIASSCVVKENRSHALSYWRSHHRMTMFLLFLLFLSIWMTTCHSFHTSRYPSRQRIRNDEVYARLQDDGSIASSFLKPTALLEEIDAKARNSVVSALPRSRWRFWEKRRERTLRLRRWIQRPTLLELSVAIDLNEVSIDRVLWPRYSSYWKLLPWWNLRCRVSSFSLRKLAAHLLENYADKSSWMASACVHTCSSMDDILEILESRTRCIEEQTADLVQSAVDRDMEYKFHANVAVVTFLLAFQSDDDSFSIPMIKDVSRLRSALRKIASLSWRRRRKTGLVRAQTMVTPVCNLPAQRPDVVASFPAMQSIW